LLQQWRHWSWRQRARTTFNALLLALVLYLLYQARGALLPFAVGFIVAYLVLPAVNWLQARMPCFLRWRKADRVLAIIIVYVVAAGLIALFIIFLVPAIVSQFEQLVIRWPAIIETVEAMAADLLEWYGATVPLRVRGFVDAQIEAAGAQIVTAVRQGVLGILGALADVVGIILGLVIIPFWLFLFLYNSGEYRQSVTSLIPESARPDVLNLGRIANDVLGSYIRGQLLVALIVASLTTVGLLLLGVNFAILLGVLVFIGNLIPTLGAILAAIPTVIIAALQEPILGLWALLVLVGVQQLESAVIGPRVVGESVRIRPALIIFLLVIGGELWELIGLLVIVPLFALVRDITRYVGQRTALQPATPEGALEVVRLQRRQILT
jgi:predicted PurR-regulated permease PerM